MQLNLSAPTPLEYFQALVGSGRVDVVLIASDDDRLSAPIEAAKLAGVTVCLLADERAQAMPRLMQQDPNWARLLREAARKNPDNEVLAGVIKKLQP